jgi:predicted O-methyltransferase YrrM
MSFLIKLAKAKKGIELGTFTGYSALCLAESLPEDGKLICSDISEEWTNIAKMYWVEAGVDKKIDLVLKPGHEVLDSLLSD